MKKRMMPVVLIFTILLALTGCTFLKKEITKEPKKEQQKTKTSYAIDNKRYAQYADALEDIVEENEWPDGTTISTEWGGYYGSNRFAISDIDGDGDEELLVEISNVPVAEMVTRVFDYDVKKDEIKEIYCGFPGMDFYNNGLIYQPASHGQSGEAIYPFELFKYNKEKKDYEWIASAHSVEQSTPYSGYDVANDADRDGVIYYVSEDMDDYQGEAYTKEAYETWFKGQKEKAEKSYIPWEYLWETSVDNIEKLSEIKGAIKPIPINIGEKITQYDVNGNAKRDRIQLVCDEVDPYYGSPEWGTKWRLLINDKAAFSFSKDYMFNLEVWLYRVSDERVYLFVKSNCDTNGDIYGADLYQLHGGEVVEQFNCYQAIISNINAFHPGIEMGYMTEEKLGINGWNQFNATAGLGWQMCYDYDKSTGKWKESNSEYVVTYNEWQEDKKDGMVANQSFKVYKNYDSEEEAFVVSRGMTIFIDAIRFYEGKTYFKVHTSRGQEGWFVDPNESYIERNGEWLNGYFNEALFAG